MPTIVLETAEEQEAPFTYTLAQALTIRPESAFAHWDGSGASGPFLAALTFRAQDGKIFSRTFPTTPIAAGGEADVSYAPFPGGIGSSGTSVSLLEDTSSDTVTVPGGGAGFAVTAPWTVVDTQGIWDYSTITNPTAKLSGLLIVTYTAQVHSATPMAPGDLLLTDLQIPAPIGVFPLVITLLGTEEATAAIPAPSVYESGAGALSITQGAELVITNTGAAPVDVSYVIRSNLIVV